MKKFVAGIAVGSILVLSTSALAEPIKQYLLTPAAYPIFVNGKEFKDESAPILNYEGSTYVPLAKLGDLTGVNYKWNDTDKRVEIVTGIPNAPVGDTSGKTAEKAAEPAASAEQKSRFVEENGQMVFYAYDKDGKFMGKFTDDADPASKNEGSLKLSEGWLEEFLFEKIYKYHVTVYSEHGKPDILIIETTDTVPKEIIRFELPISWIHNSIKDEAVINNVKIKRNGIFMYYNIEDLQKAGVIK